MGKEFRLLISLISIKFVLVAAYLLSGALSLAPDEAQYWLWSQNLDWGYYSKPPGVAWQIFLGTVFWGNSEFGVRFMALVMGSLIPIGVYQLARRAQLTERLAFWAAAAMALSPAGMLATILSTTDGGLVLFWTLAMVAVCGNPISFPLVGLTIACGALFKWPIYLIWIPIFAFRSGRKAFFGFGLSLLGLLPSLIWNSQHDWATFRHVAATVAGRPAEGLPFFNGNFFDFFAAQAALVSPILFGLLVVGLVNIWRERRSLPATLRFCAAVTALFLGTYMLLAIKQKMQGNWVAFAYPSAMVVIAWQAGRRIAFLKWGVALSLVACLFFGFLPTLQRHSIPLVGFRPPYYLNILFHNHGWDRIPLVLEETGYDPDKHFLFAARYQTSCVLSFYGPKQKQAHFFNFHHQRKNQFSYWPSMAEQEVGNTGYYMVYADAKYLALHKEALIKREISGLQPYFDSVELATLSPLFESYGTASRSALVFRCTNYKGGEPLDPEMY